MDAPGHTAKIFVWVIISASLVSAGTAFYRFYVARDYSVFANVFCDSTVYSCFVGDGENAPQSYKVISKIANTIPACNGWSGQCSELTCEPGDPDCTVEYCNPGIEDTCIGPTSSEQ